LIPLLWVLALGVFFPSKLVPLGDCNCEATDLLKEKMTIENGENCCVKVAVHIRPLIPDEKLQGCKDCVSVPPGQPQVLPLSFLFCCFFISLALCKSLLVQFNLLFSLLS
jgi:hypothetical protein